MRGASMKVLDLQCGHGHRFEGWFGSEDDFQGQLARSLVACPLCGDTGIKKMLSAPRLNLGAQPADSPIAPAQTNALAIAEPHAPPAPLEPPSAEQQARWLHMVREVLANTEDVGEQFADEARRMHYGETDHRQIRGHATTDEALQLLDEGIPVMPLPLPVALKGRLH